MHSAFIKFQMFHSLIPLDLFSFAILYPPRVQVRIGAFPFPLQCVVASRCRGIFTKEYDDDGNDKVMVMILMMLMLMIGTTIVM